MTRFRTVVCAGLLAVGGALTFGTRPVGGSDDAKYSPVIPKTWDEAEMKKLEVPLAHAEYSPAEVPTRYYYQIPERPIYKQYPIYPPDREPAGYWAQLQNAEPEVLWGKDSAGLMHRPPLNTKADWIKAGELVFFAPSAYNNTPGTLMPVEALRAPEYFASVRPPLTPDGIFPFGHYVVRKKGTVELGQISCGMCHTRVTPDGAVIEGAQGNFPFDLTVSMLIASLKNASPDTRKNFEEGGHQVYKTFFSVPWLKPDPAQIAIDASLDQTGAIYAAVPPGVLDRQGSSNLFPVQIPDLIGVQDRLYLDHTGLLRQHGPGDMMRYGSLNQDMNLLGNYKAWIPLGDKDGNLPPPDGLGRYSDEQLYALTLFLYSLRPPPNPNKFDEVAQRGQVVFNQEGCPACHAPPLYTNNKLTLAAGFAKPDDTHGDAVMPISVGTDARLALQTRRGTGYYKVPSLKGVWYRGPFEHNGSVKTLEDWFDAARLKDDYVPTAFVGYKVTHRAVPGHLFGINLPAEDKRALIAFLKTL